MIKKGIVIIALFGISLLMANCKTAKTATSSNPHAETIASLNKTYTGAQLAEGKTIFETKCARCHKLYVPASHNFDAWERILPKMSQNAKLSDDKAALVRAYVLTNTKS